MHVDSHIVVKDHIFPMDSGCACFFALVNLCQRPYTFSWTLFLKGP
jgi:hypothetical protein